MRFTSMAIRASVAVVFAAISVLGEVLGCIVLLGLGIGALIALHHVRPMKVASSQRRMAPFLSWIACIVLYACCVMLLTPLASFPAVVFALLFLSPLFGTLVLLTSTALTQVIQRGN